MLDELSSQGHLRRTRLVRLKFWGFSVCEALMRESRALLMAAGSCTTAASLILTLPLDPADACYRSALVTHNPAHSHAPKYLQPRVVSSPAGLAGPCTLRLPSTLPVCLHKT